MTLRYDQDLAHNPKLLDELNDFLENVVSKDHPTAARNLQDAIRSAMELFSMNQTRSSIFNMEQFTGFDDYSFSAERPSLSMFDPRELAAQMTSIDSRYFKSIRVSFALFLEPLQASKLKQSTCSCRSLLDRRGARTGRRPPS